METAKTHRLQQDADNEPLEGDADKYLDRSTHAYHEREGPCSFSFLLIHRHRSRITSTAPTPRARLPLQRHHFSSTSPPPATRPAQWANRNTSCKKHTKSNVCARALQGGRMRTRGYQAAPTYGGRQGVGVQGPPSRLGLDLVEHLDEVAGAELLWHPEGRQKSLVPTELDRNL